MVKDLLQSIQATREQYSKNEMNIRISLCNVRRVNGMLDISLEIRRSEKDALQSIQVTREQ